MSVTYGALSTPGSNVGEIFEAGDIAIAGSGQGELSSGPDEAVAVANVVSSRGFRWTAEELTVWRRREVAWAQIPGSVRVVRDGVVELVSYRTTGVFGLDGGGWRWLDRGGSEPQESAKV